MPNLTATYSWQQPLVNDPIDQDVWGNELNSNLAAQDTLLSTVGITPTGALTVKDNNFTVVDNGDVTKAVVLDVAAVTTATTRTLAVQDVSGTLYVTGGQDVAVSDGGTGVSTVLGVQSAFGIFQHIQSFSSNGTFTPAAGVARVYVEVWGPGAGGGGSAGGGNGGGGGAGGYSAGFIDVTPTVGCTVTVGTGGSAGGSGNNAGSAGNGASSFAGPSINFTANAGGGGSGGAGAGVHTPGGAGGTALNGDMNFNGGDGDFGQQNTVSSNYAGGAGGDAPKGGQGGRIGAGTNTIAPGGAGKSPGGGGSGAFGLAAGGTGANGLVIVYYP